MIYMTEIFLKDIIFKREKQNMRKHFFGYWIFLLDLGHLFQVPAVPAVCALWTPAHHSLLIRYLMYCYFRCSICKLRLMQVFFSRKKKLYCQQHYLAKYNYSCHKCHKKITGLVQVINSFKSLLFSLLISSKMINSRAKSLDGGLSICRLLWTFLYCLLFCSFFSKILQFISLNINAWTWYFFIIVSLSIILEISIYKLFTQWKQNKSGYCIHCLFP